MGWSIKAMVIFKVFFPHPPQKGNFTDYGSISFKQEYAPPFKQLACALCNVRVHLGKLGKFFRG